MNKQKQWAVIKRLFGDIRNSSRLYTGNSIKKLIKEQVLELKQPFNNNPINSGRWAAYCHYSRVMAFSNLLDKHQIDTQSTVVVHPLLPAEMVDEIIRRGAAMIVVDISINSLAMDHAQLATAIESEPDLIIHFTDNGLCSEITELVDYTNALRIPTLLHVESDLPNQELLDLFEKINFGSVLWNFGDSFLDDQLNKVLDISLKNQKWYVSWFIENRTHSSLEYHLSSSKDTTVPLLENYLFLLLKDYEQHGWKEKLLPLAYGVLKQDKVSNKAQAQQKLAESFQDIFTSAIPDVVFEIELLDPIGMRPNNIQDVHDLEHYIHAKNQELFSYVQSREGINVEPHDVKRSYFKAVLFTTSKSAWTRYFQDKDLQLKNFEVHPEINKLKHTNVSLLVNQGLVADFSQFLYN